MKMPHKNGVAYQRTAESCWQVLPCTNLCTALHASMMRKPSLVDQYLHTLHNYGSSSARVCAHNQTIVQGTTMHVCQASKKNEK